MHLVENRPSADTAFVGRTEELRAIAEAAAAARAGNPSVIVVEGEAGIGKTALVREAVRGLKDFSLYWAVCDSSEHDFSYQVVEQITRRVPRHLLEKFPLLAHGVPPGASAVETGAQLIQLMGMMQEDGPVAIIIDDVHWADDASIQVLGFGFRRMWTERVLVVITARTESAAMATGGLPRLLSAVSRRWLGLGGLSDDEVVRLATTLGAGELSPPVLRRLRDHTHGHPLHLRSILLSATAGELADRKDILTVPPTVEATVRRTLSGLAPDSRALLDAMAVINTRLPLVGLAQLAGVDHPAEALGPLLQSGLVDWLPSDPASPVGIRHALQRDAVYAALDPRARKNLHARAAELVGQEESWYHRVAAADRTDPELADALESAADRALVEGQPRRAASLLLWAADLSAERADGERRLLTASLHLLTVRDVQRAATLRDRIERCARSALRDCVLALAATPGVDDELIRRYLTGAVSRAEADGDRAMAALANAWLGAQYVAEGRPDEASSWLRRALQSGALPTDVDHRMRWMLAGCAAMLQGPAAGRQTADESMHLPATAQVPGPKTSLLLLGRGAMRVLAGDLTRGIDDFTMLLSRKARDGEVPEEATVHFMVAMAQYWLGSWADAAISVDQALAGAFTEDQVWAYSPSYAVAAMIAAGQGRWDSAVEYYDSCESTAGGTFRRIFAVYPVFAGAALAQARDRPKDMITALRPVLDAPATGPHRMYDTWLVPLQVEALIGAGDLDAVESRLAELGRLAEGAPSLRVHLAWSTGRLAEVRGQTDRALAMYDQGVALPADEDEIPLHRAGLQHARGALLAGLGRIPEAVNQLEAAHQVYTKLGATPFADRVEQQLARFSGRPARAAADDARAGLTERESAVAHLAARGMTNNEIATELFISAKTVEYHLSHVFAKLHVGSRRELRHMLG